MQSRGPPFVVPVKYWALSVSGEVACSCLVFDSFRTKMDFLHRPPSNVAGICGQTTAHK